MAEKTEEEIEKDVKFDYVVVFNAQNRTICFVHAKRDEVIYCGVISPDNKYLSGIFHYKNNRHLAVFLAVVGNLNIDFYSRVDHFTFIFCGKSSKSKIGKKLQKGGHNA